MYIHFIYKAFLLFFSLFLYVSLSHLCTTECSLFYNIISVLTGPPIRWVPGALSLGVKRPGREADHSPPTRAEIKKTWVYTSTPPYVFMA
jgi:hypothetical protein